LAAAYYLKEELGEFWEQGDEDEATAFLLDWLARAEELGDKTPQARSVSEGEVLPSLTLRACVPTPRGSFVR
jgi:hypothetical protein